MTRHGTRMTRGALRRCVAASALLLCTIAPSTVAGGYAPGVNGTGGSTLLVLGDSLTWGANYFAKTQSQLAATQTFDDVIVDGWWSRRIGGIASTTYSGANTYKNTYLKKRVYPTAVIVALGTNDVYFLSKKREYIAVIRELMDAIGPVPVVWLNVHRVDSSRTTARSRVFNRTLERVLAEYPLASVYDWANKATTTSRLMAFDKIHLTPSGYKVRSNVYAELATTLAQRVSDATSTTTTTIDATTTTIESTTTIQSTTTTVATMTTVAP